VSKLVAGTVLVVLVLAVTLAGAGCSGDDDATSTTTTTEPPPPEDFPEDPEARETLDRFVQAAGKRDTATMWSLLDSASQQRYGPTEAEFAAGPGSDLSVVLGSFARKGGSYDHVLAKKVSDLWSVAAINGFVTLEGKEEWGAYAAVVDHEDGEPKISLAGTVTFTPVTPEPELVSGPTPSVATEVSASEPVLDAVIWVDDTRIAAELAPDAILLTGEVTTPLEPGRHAVVTFADTQSGAGANAYSFESK
jgi:hypothetical protein